MIKKYKWWLETVGTGLLPFIMRSFVYFIFTKLGSSYIFNETDMIAFGLVMITTNAQELDRNQLFDEDWKEIIKSVSNILLVLISGVLFATYFTDGVTLAKSQRTVLKLISFGLAALSFMVSLAIVYKPKIKSNSG
jgi:translation elongation factor EF-1beta